MVKIGLLLQTFNRFAIDIIIITLFDNLLHWIALHEMVRAVSYLLVLEAKVFAFLCLGVIR